MLVQVKYEFYHPLYAFILQFLYYRSIYNIIAIVHLLQYLKFDKLISSMI